MGIFPVSWVTVSQIGTELQSEGRQVHKIKARRGAKDDTFVKNRWLKGERVPHTLSRMAAFLASKLDPLNKTPRLPVSNAHNTTSKAGLWK